MELTKSHKTYGGKTAFWKHQSLATKTTMALATFTPGGNDIQEAVIWLSGLTCTEENFITKSGVQRLLADTKTMIVAPDTSPRGLNLPGEHESYDFGSGAGFYVDAITNGYCDHYQMFSYVVRDLVHLIREHFGVTRLTLMGHSMGGHGALVLGLRNPDVFHRIVAFAPIVNPSQTPWGMKALKGYLGDSDWGAYDACQLLKRGYRHHQEITIFQGTKDEFLGTELQPEIFHQIARQEGQACRLLWCEDYDHSYYFISSFLGDALSGVV